MFLEKDLISKQHIEILNHLSRFVICMNCGSSANFTHRLSHEEKMVVLGEQNEYESLCRECYNESIK